MSGNNKQPCSLSDEDIERARREGANFKPSGAGSTKLFKTPPKESYSTSLIEEIAGEPFYLF